MTTVLGLTTVHAWGRRGRRLLRSLSKAPMASERGQSLDCFVAYPEGLGLKLRPIGFL